MLVILNILQKVFDIFAVDMKLIEISDTDENELRYYKYSEIGNKVLLTWEWFGGSQGAAVQSDAEGIHGIWGFGEKHVVGFLKFKNVKNIFDYSTPETKISLVMYFSKISVFHRR